MFVTSSTFPKVMLLHCNFPGDSFSIKDTVACTISLAMYKMTIFPIGRKNHARVYAYDPTRQRTRS
jgi:hypothetical protein